MGAFRVEAVDMNETHAWLIFMEEYQTVLVVIATMVVGVFTGVLGAIFGFLKFKEVRLRKVEQAIGHKVLAGDEALATISIVKQCGARIEKKLEDHEAEEDKVLDNLRKDIEYIRSVIDRFIADLATQALRGE